MKLNPCHHGLLLSLIMFGSAKSAEPPQIERTFPAGGQRGTSVNVQLGGKTGGEPLQLWSDFGQLTMQATDKPEVVKITIPPDATAGLHRVRFFNSAGASAVRAFVVGSLPEIAEVEPNNAVAEATPVSAGAAVVNGVLEKSGDVDTIALTLSEGQTVVLSMLAHRELASPMDPVLQLLDMRGNVLAQNDDDHGNDPQIVHRVQISGRYFVRTFAFPAQPDSSIRFSGAESYIYRLTVTTGPFVNHTMPLAVQRDQKTTVRLVGWNIPEERLRLTVDPEAVGRKSPGSKLTAADDEPHPLQSISLVEDFAVPVRVATTAMPSWTEDELRGANSTSQPTGDSTSDDGVASNSDSARDGGTALASRAAQVSNSPVSLPAGATLPLSISGIVARDDEADLYIFRGVKNQKLRVRVVARTFFSLLDPVVAVNAADGRELISSDDISGDNPDAQTDVTLPGDGDYTIQVTDRFDHGGRRYFYRLDCEEITPDFRITVKESAFVLPAGQPLEIAVTIERRDGFDQPLEISASGLPAVVAVEKVTSLKDGETSKAVKLKLTGKSASGYSGEFRIIATPADGKPKSATFELMNSTTTLDRLWITIPATK